MQNKKLQQLKETCNKCQACALGLTRNNIVFSDGVATAPILLIGEAPGHDEDIQGKPFVGRAGKLLTEFLNKAGLSREKDIYICNTVKCRPPKNRVPSLTEKQACREYLLEQIKLVNPKVIVLCGATATASFIQTKEKISKLRGKWLKILDDINTMVIFHPSYLLRNHSLEENSPRSLTLNDLKNIKEKAFS